MTQTRVRHDGPEPQDPEPRWPALMVLLALGGLSAAWPPSLLLGDSRWLLLVVVVVRLVP